MSLLSRLLKRVSLSIAGRIPHKRKTLRNSPAFETLEDRVLLTVTFQFNYIPTSPANIGFDDPTSGTARREALQRVADEFGSWFTNTATIQMDVTSSDNIASNTLASAGSQSLNIGPGFGPEVIRTKIMTGSDGNGMDADGSVDVNWGNNWEISANPADVDNMEFDFTATILHELAHAVGFASGILEGGQDLFLTQVGDPGYWNFFDQFITTVNETPVINSTTFVLDATAWSNRTGGNSASNVGLFFNGPLAKAANGGNPIGLYTPTTWIEGSSVSHTDDENPAFADTMMLSTTGAGLGARTFSAIERAIMQDLGFIFVAPSANHDVVVWDSTSGILRVGASDGTKFGLATSGTFNPTGGWGFHQGDFNGDGLLDVAGFNNASQWWVGISNGTTYTTSYFGSLNNAGGWQNIQVGDFDNDGDSDILAQNSSGQWWLNRSNGTSFNVSYAGQWASSGWTDIVNGDFNNDGRMDLAGIKSGQWWVALSNGNTITTSFWRQWDSAGGWQDIRVGDFDNDGDDDVFARKANGQWWIGRSTGSSFETVYGTTWNEALGWNDVSVGDFDGDGRADIAGRTNAGFWYVASSNGVRLLNKEWGRWNQTTNWQTAVGDFNGDGIIDIAGYAPETGQWWVAAGLNEKRFENTYFRSWGAEVGSVGFIGGGQIV